MTTRRARRAVAAAGAAVATVLVAGCTLLLPQQGQAGAAPAPPAAAPPGTARAPADPAAQAGSLIASQEVRSDGSTLRVDLTGLTREGRLITLTWNVTMIEPGSQDWYPGTRM